MLAKYILAVLACVFLALTLTRSRGEGSSLRMRAWLLVGTIFAAVSAFLFYQQGL